MKYSMVELSFSLFIFALFVNSAILIVAGAALGSVPDIGEASLFSIHSLLADSLAPAAGTVFALALLLSGVSAGIICTITGQMVSEGALNWTISPWLRRLLTRSISITPSIIIAGAVGRDGLTAALNGSQVALSVVLPFVSAPLIFFTSNNKYMTVKAERFAMGTHNQDRCNPVNDGREEMLGGDSAAGEGEAQMETPQGGGIKMGNSWVSIVFATLVWLLIALMNVTNIVLLGLGK
jgi:metal iron transporter